jgi:sulfatase maturation enzyme AslB (radical SAM superfamily)
VSRRSWGWTFLRRVVEVEKKDRKPGMRIENPFQINGVLLGHQQHEAGIRKI